MTKIKTEIGWVYLVIVLDWYSKKIVGKQVGLASRTEDWLVALEEGLHKQYPEGVQGKELKLVSDNGCQPTSHKFMKSCNTLGIKQIFTSYNNPKGNAETERAIRTLKEELFWLKEWQGVKQVEDALNDWVKSYNATRFSKEGNVSIQKIDIYLVFNSIFLDLTISTLPKGINDPTRHCVCSCFKV